jgi:hypothetical protein
MRFPITRRKDHSAIHEAMDPFEDRVEIFQQLLLHEFPMEFLLAAEIAQLRSFTFPRGTKLLHATREFENHSEKRLDDTRAILYEIGRDTFYSPRAEMMAAHLNKIHSFYKIPNHEFLHTLSTFIFDVWEFINSYGYRKLTRNEELAIYYCYCRMGELMNIQDIPETFEAYWQWKLDYEAENQAYAESNHQVAEGLIRGIKAMLPTPLSPFVLPFVLSLMKDRRIADLVGYRYPNRLVRGFFRAFMWGRRLLTRYFTIWDVLSFESVFFSSYKSYPNGYNPLRLGPSNLIKQIAAEEDELSTGL